MAMKWDALMLNDPRRETNSNNASTSRKPSVLVVDDDPFIRALAQSKLDAAGFNVILMEDGCYSDKLFSMLEFDAALVDLGLPQISGQEVIEKIRSHSRNSNAPIFVITASRDLDEIRDCYQKHATSLVLPKPINWNLLINHLQEELVLDAA